MKLAKSVTFGASGLDRAAHLRTGASELLTNGTSTVLPLWSEKPLVQGQESLGLGWLAPDADGLSDAAEAPIFLGLDNGVARFATNLSKWTPDLAEGAELDSFLDSSEQIHPLFPAGSRFSELRAIMTELSPRDAELAATARGLISWHARHRFCANCGAPTTIAMAGWQRDCAACGTSHYPRTDPVVIMLITRGNNVLVGRSPGWPEGMFSLLAGFIEPGETIESAVRREVQEEAGITVGEVSYLVSQPWPFPASLMLACRGEALDDEITIDPEEIEEARWVSREEMMLAFSGDHPEISAARHGAIARFVLERWLSDRLDEPMA